MRLIFFFLLVIMISPFAYAQGSWEDGTDVEITRDPAPDLVFRTIKKQKVRLSDYRGKVVYFDAWASWCQPCFIAFPSLAILEEDYAGQDVVFLTVNTDKKKKKWKKASKKNSIPGINVWAGKKGNAVDAFGIYTLPRYILIDKSGKIYESQAKFPSSVRGDIDYLLSE